MSITKNRRKPIILMEPIADKSDRAASVNLTRHSEILETCQHHIQLLRGYEQKINFFLG